MNRPNPLETLPARFAAKVVKDGECWRWVGGKTAKGYGHITIGKGNCRMAHRVSWELHRGPIPDGMQIDHLCRNTSCVNPDHLEPVTPALNNARSFSPAALNAEKERCVRGHDLAEARIYRGVRVCTQCRAIRQRESRARTAGMGPGRGSTQRGKTHCPQGHAYDETNTYVTRSGRRMCRECGRERHRLWAANRRAQLQKDAEQ